MRTVTRRAILLLVLVIVALLALGVLPSFLKTGDPYYLTAEQVNESILSGNETALSGNQTAVNVTGLSEQRFPHTTEALQNGTSDAYYRGPWGLKESFTHSPFDEISALRQGNASAVVGEGILVRNNGTLYRLAIRRQP